jgi:hypothetical protein
MRLIRTIASYRIDILGSDAHASLCVDVVVVVDTIIPRTSLFGCSLQTRRMRSRGRALLSNDWAVILRFPFRLTTTAIAFTKTSANNRCCVRKPNHDFEEK